MNAKEVRHALDYQLPSMRDGFSIVTGKGDLRIEAGHTADWVARMIEVTLRSQQLEEAARVLRSRAKTPAIEKLMEAAFAQARTPRSDAYKAGVKAKLYHKLAQQEIVCQYMEGTAEFDAFQAGIDEGRAILRAQA
jgi:hypothetical protein